MIRSLLIAVAVVVTTVTLIAADPYLLNIYRSVAPDGEFARSIAVAAEYTLDPPIVLVAFMLYALFISADRFRRFGMLVATMLTQATLVCVMKRFFGRMRPADLVAQLGFFGPTLGDGHNSFPGGHATGAFALATILACWHPRWRWAFYGVATIITLSRIHLERHFFSDCFLGGCLGYWIARAFVHYLDPAASPRPQTQAQPKAEH